MKSTLGLAVAVLLLAATPAFAQAPPGGVPYGAGYQLGVEEINDSGQVGFVTLFDAGPAHTRIVTAIEGAPAGHVEAVAIQHGRGCRHIEPGIIVHSADMHNGISRGVVPISQDRLLSGNYVVVVYSETHPGARAVACGWLYR